MTHPTTLSASEAQMRRDPAKRAKYNRLRQGPYLDAVVAANRAYLKAAVPDPIGTERDRWALSCLPGHRGRLSAINMRTMEIFVLHEPTEPGDTAHGFMVVRRSVLARHAGQDRDFDVLFPRLRFDEERQYRDAGPDQIVLRGRWADLVAALADERCAEAAAPEGVRYGLLVRTCLEVLRDSGEWMPGRVGSR